VCVGVQMTEQQSLNSAAHAMDVQERRQAKRAMA